MSKIAAEVGGSKATLYNYFPNKEQLFVEVALTIIGQMAEDAAMSLDPKLPPLEKIRVLGTKYLSNDSVSLYRNVVTYEGFGKLGRDAYKTVLRSTWGHIADLIDVAMREGGLKKADPWLAAMQLKSLFQLDTLDRRFLQFDKSISDEEIEKNVRIGLAIFEAYYRV